MTIPLFDVPADLHGAAGGVSRHTRLREPFCPRCQAFVDELVASGDAVRVAEGRRPSEDCRPGPGEVAPGEGSQVVSVREPGVQITDVLELPSRRFGADTELVTAWVGELMTRYEHVDDVDWEVEGDLVTVTATVSGPLKGGRKRTRRADNVGEVDRG